MEIVCASANLADIGRHSGAAQVGLVADEEELRALRAVLGELRMPARLDVLE